MQGGTNEFGRIFTSLVVRLGNRRRTQVFGRINEGHISAVVVVVDVTAAGTKKTCWGCPSQGLNSE